MAAKITKDRAHYLLGRSFAFGDIAIDLGGGRMAIASKGRDTGYLVTKTSCECEGFRRRGECRHFVFAAWIRQGRPDVPGVTSGDVREDCRHCEGSGKRRYWTGDLNGWVYPQCGACNGTGKAA